MRYRSNLSKFVFQVCLSLALVVGLVIPSANVKAVSSDLLPQDIKAILTDYSEYLSNGTTLAKSQYSSQISALIGDRRQYYKEFFEKGLHSNLDSLTAQFVTDEKVKFSQRADLYNLKLTEVVTMYGQPMTTNAEEYPLVQAAQWALGQTDDSNVRRALEEYITSMKSGVDESVLSGVQIVFIVSHDIDITGKDGQLQIVRDAFTDKSNDNGEGFDNVIWSNGQALRHKPDWKQMPDYAIYNTPIEDLGHSLLEDYTKTYGQASPAGTGFYYSRTAAKNYINTYSSNPSTYCSSVLQNTSKYNTAYQSVWSQTGCNDCVDYVSQALRAGAFPTDGTWYPSINSYAWNVTDGLLNYLISLAAVQEYSSYTSLQVGDLAFTSGLGHVIMVAGVNPHTMSGHTNDRLKYAWSSSLTEYWHVNNYIP